MNVMTRKRGEHTPTPWRARPVRFGNYVLEAELMCLNGLRAWFTIATVHPVEDQEILMSEGAKAVARLDAEFIGAAVNSYAELAGLRAENETLVKALKSTLAALLATTSVINRAEDIKKQPSKAVASDKIFWQMLQDYEAATNNARAALRAHDDFPSTPGGHHD